MRQSPQLRLTLSLLLLSFVSLAPCSAGAQQAPQASNPQLIDRPNDDGTALLLTFDLAGANPETTFVSSQIQVDGTWLPGSIKPARLLGIDTYGGLPEFFGWYPDTPDRYVLTVDRYMEPPPADATDGSFRPVTFEAGQTYAVRLVIGVGGDRQDRIVQLLDAGSATTAEQWFNRATANNLILCLIFAAIIMSFILAARRNPNLFIRRIQGLEAVDEAIGRATEMGKPVLHINGLDPLSTLSTIAAVNILGRIARRVANYESDLLVPCFDPVVMTVSQEVVKNAYLEAGRPDSYREENIYFLTDQQFSYVASVCGIMVRERPAANFMLGMFYAESLVLAETGYTTGAIQIAGTDALAQLPFFITTCDYTLIGEELYAASAYLSREPMLLGSLKGQDIGKAFVMLMIILGSILATIGGYLAKLSIDTAIDWQWLSHVMTPLT